MGVPENQRGCLRSRERAREAGCHRRPCSRRPQSRAGRRRQLDSGVVTFRRADLQTDKTTASFTGKFRISDGSTDLLTKIHSEDFSELDRIGYNFAHSAGKKTYTLLGLGGAGDISGTIKGPLK